MYRQDKFEIPASEVKHDPFTLEALIAWLEKQVPAETYNYVKPRTCLIGQFTGVSLLSDEVDERCFVGAHSIAYDGEWTFGAALDRARAALASRP